MSISDKVTIERYDSYLIVRGNTKPHTEMLKEAGGRWNPIFNGWLFFPADERKALKVVNTINFSVSSSGTESSLKKKIDKLKSIMLDIKVLANEFHVKSEEISRDLPEDLLEEFNDEAVLIKYNLTIVR